CPKTLLGLGAKPTGPADRWVTGHHFFICIEADAKRCLMLPLYSHDGPGRSQISMDGRSGHEKWTLGAHYYHPVQTWLASRFAIARAAQASGDLTRSGSRNLLQPDLIPVLPPPA
ncbi:hypothetical protein PV762_02320, partial [Mitsuaria sp. CC2]|uniref:hypothetical protein n=1 Tax=Mitsuaria sp. CC2 TaxID=3029186 RepID=UPI003B8B88E9